MKIRIKNLGVIEEGTIDLSKRVNLLCGQNGTGKTYLAYTIYGMLRTRLHIPADTELADQLINNRTSSKEIDFSILSKYRDGMFRGLKEGIGTLFGISDELVEKEFSRFSMVQIETEKEFEQFILSSEITGSSRIQGINIQYKKKTGENTLSLTIIDENIPNDYIPGFRLLLNSFIYHTLAIYPVSGVAIFPVERNSIYTFSKELSIRKQEAMDNLQLMVDKDKKINKFDILFNSKRYPLPVKDGLVVAEDLAERKKTKSQFFHFAEALESDLLQGKVQISSDGEIQFRPLKSPRTVLPIQMTASIVKTLSSLVVYLKHIAHHNDLIIIDEPEINLHPDNQIILARLLSRLANAGFRLLVSTHSDYIIREFNNLVMVAERKFIPSKNSEGHFGYQDDEYINREDLAVHFFEYKSKKAKNVIVSDVKIDQFGFSIDSIDDIINRQNRTMEDLYYSLKYTDDNE